MKKNIIDELRDLIAVVPDTTFPEQWADEYATALRNSLLRQFVKKSNDVDKRVLRISSLGRPAVLQALNIPSVREQLSELNLWNNVEPNSFALRDAFHRGDQFEAFMIFHLRRLGFNIISTQECVNFLGVEGHPDVVIERNGERLLLEIKTLSDNYFRQFVRDPDDERGYVTQLSLYQACLNVPAVWLCLNKCTHELVVVEPNVEALAKAKERAERIIPLFEKIKSFEDIFKYFKAPPPIREFFKRRQTGRKLLPLSMRYSPHRQLFYHILVEENGYGKATEYVVDYTQPSDLLL